MWVVLGDERLESQWRLTACLMENVLVAAAHQEGVEGTCRTETGSDLTLTDKLLRRRGSEKPVPSGRFVRKGDPFAHVVVPAAVSFVETDRYLHRIATVLATRGGQYTDGDAFPTLCMHGTTVFRDVVCSKVLILKRRGFGEKRQRHRLILAFPSQSCLTITCQRERSPAACA